MTFLHLAFLGGALAIVVPIALHLLMRQQPKHLEFPALRFIKLRQSANRRQMRLRHWLLLALRCAVIALLALALARPSILASGMLGDQEAPLAAALVFDTSPRLQYRQNNKTRLEVATDTAKWLLPQLPRESDVAVVDTQRTSAAFAVDPGAARQRVERLETGAATQPLALALENAVKLVRESEKPRKEVYVFTDLARAAWSSDAMRDVSRQLRELQDVGIYIIDVGATDPNNLGLGALRLSGEVLPKNAPLGLDVELVHAGGATDRGIELYLLDRDTGSAALRDQKQLSLAPGESQHVSFTLLGLSDGLHQGYIKFNGEDALPADDAHWFTVSTRPAWRVLIAAPRDAHRRPDEYALFLDQALAPHAMRIKGEAEFACDVIGTDELAKKPLDAYAAVCLVDPAALPASVWQRLHSFVSTGGGLGVFLGRNASPVDAFNEPTAQSLLPGKLSRQWRAADGVFFAPPNYEHPALARLRLGENTVPWELAPVFRHWQLTDVSKDLAVIVPMTNGQPALLERPVGKGRVMMLTTPVSDTANSDAWNLLPTSESAWAYQLLVQGAMAYLVGGDHQRLNYTAGESAVVHVGADERAPVYALTTPRSDQIRLPLDDKQNALVVAATEAPGNYRLQAGGGDKKVELGFSVNLPRDISQLERTTPEELKTVFGDAPFRLARSRDEIDRSVSAARVGQELFPYLIVLLVVVLAAEQVLANRFYQDYDTAPKESAAAKFAQSATPPPLPKPQVPVDAR